MFCFHFWKLFGQPMEEVFFILISHSIATEPVISSRFKNLYLDHGT